VVFSYSFYSHTFPPIFGLFTIFDRNLAKIVAPPSDECENYDACLTVQSIPEKKLQTASKSAYKRQLNACSNYAPLERTALRTRSVTNKKKQTKKQTPHFRTYSRRALYDLPQTLHGDRARRAHHKWCHPFFDPTYSFSYRVHGKIWPNLPTRGFSAITP